MQTETFRKNTVRGLALLCSAIFLGLAFSQAFATSTNIDSITYPLEEWDQHLLEIIDKGPILLQDLEEFLPEPFPANSSEETQKEIDYLEDLSKTARNDKTRALILEENDAFYVWDSFENAALVVLDDEKNKELVDVLKMANNELSFFLMKYKKHFSRARPSQLRPELELVIDNPRHAAYPSGHATQSYSTGLILSLVDADNTDKYMDMARSIAHRREIAGVHYPSDSKAGQILAEKVVNKLMELPQFQIELQQAKESFIKAQGLENYEMQMTDHN